MARKAPTIPSVPREPHPRPYVRDGVPGLPMAEQEAMLVAAGVPMDAAYRDELTRAKIKRRDPAELAERAQLLRPTGRTTAEMIYMAGLRCFGWTLPDIARCLVLAAQRNASVHAVDIGQTYSAATLHEATALLHGLADAWDAHRRGHTLAGRTAAAEARSKKALAKREAKLAKARPLWLQDASEISIAEIAEQVGMSVRSLQQHLGPRSEARAKAKRRKPHA